MIPVAHVGGLPLEEILPAIGGPGAGLLVGRAWLILRFRHDREPEK
jgi:hypothetical protein